MINQLKEFSKLLMFVSTISHRVLVFLLVCTVLFLLLFSKSLSLFIEDLRDVEN